MQERLGANRWWNYIIVAFGYGIGVSLFRQLDVPHFMLLCGLHMAVLMLSPYRYWPALFVAEGISQVPMAIECASQWGLTWALLKPIPGTLVSAPVVYLFREHFRLFDRRNEGNLAVLLTCALAVAVIMTADNMVLFSSIVYRGNASAPHYDHLAAQWILGNFLGALTVVPITLAIRSAVRQHGWRGWFVQLSESRLVFESTCFAMPALMALLWLGFSVPHMRSFAQAAMFLPVVWLAIRHGWRGAAFGGTVASFAVMWLMPVKYDHATIQAEVIVAFVISTMLLVGERIEALDLQVKQERMEMRAALALAQRNVHLGEMQLRMAAQAVEQARETVRAGYAMMLGRLRHLQPAIDDKGYQRVALSAQEQLFGIYDSLHPVAWKERGLLAALSEGGVARALDYAGLRYWCEFKGPLSYLSSTVHIALYRMINEAIAEGCTRRDMSDICVRIRSGDVRGRRWVVVSIVFRAGVVRLSYVRWEDFLVRLVRTTSGMGLKAIKDRAATFEGYARERTFQAGRRISWIMLDL